MQRGFSLPTIPDAGPEPISDDAGAKCRKDFKISAPIPTKQSPTSDLHLVVEDGFKEVRGNLTEGRYLTFESNGSALASTMNGKLVMSKSTTKHDDLRQRWIVHQLDVSSNGDLFNISSALDGKWIAQKNTLSPSMVDAASFAISNEGTSIGYTLKIGGGEYLGAGSNGEVALTKTPSHWRLFSVTYN
jgi:phospholipase C